MQRFPFLTWLPLSHSYEHTVQFVQIAVGAEIYYAESIEKLIKKKMTKIITKTDLFKKSILHRDTIIHFKGEEKLKNET